MTPGINITPLLRQCFLSVGGMTIVMGIGFVGGITSMVITQILESKYIEMNESKISWFASIIGITAIFGMVIASTTMKYLGRKTAVLLAASFMVIGWICTYVASSYGMLLFGRSILGLALGSCAVANPIYLGECISPKYRGCLLATNTLFLSTGVFICHLMANNLGWQKTAAISCAVECFALCIIFFCPESPSILAVKGKYDECKVAFRWLRGYNEEEELDNLIKSAMVSAEDKAKKNTGDGKVSVIDKLKYIQNMFLQRHFYKPMIIVALFNVISEWSGITLMDNYTIDVTRIISGESDEMSAIIYSVDIQRIFSSLLATFVYRAVSRRSMFKTLISFNILIYYIIAAYVYAKKYQLLTWDHPWLGGLLIHLHMFSVSLGASPLPTIVYSEILSLEFKSISGLLFGLTFSLSYFVNMKIVPYLFSSIGLHGAYTIFGSILLVCMIIIWFMLPETKDKTLQKIEEGFKSKKINSVPVTPVELETFLS